MFIANQGYIVNKRQSLGSYSDMTFKPLFCLNHFIRLSPLKQVSLSLVGGCAFLNLQYIWKLVSKSLNSSILLRYSYHHWMNFFNEFIKPLSHLWSAVSLIFSSLSDNFRGVVGVELLVNLKQV